MKTTIIRTNIIVSTDGACSGNPGPGGYAAILRFGEHEKIITGFNEKTTNNRMELTALIEAAKSLKKPCNILVRTDSKYVCTGIANAKEWEANGWKTKSGARCANHDLWQILAQVKTEGNHRFQYVYVPGHSGDNDNELCDKLARDEIRTHKEL